MQLKKGFTLAEVLITLGMIGVVAALTLPSLIENYKEKERVTALKKFYSVISQAYAFAIAEHGELDSWGSEANSEEYLTRIAPYLKIIKLCGVGEKCHPSTDYKLRNGNFTVTTDLFNPKNKLRHGAVLADGMIVSTYIFTPNCSKVSGSTTQLQHVCGEYIVDINGGQKPNQYGKDIFIFSLTKYGIVPNGTPDYAKEAYNFSNGCLSSTAAGWGCTAWVIQNENMDYWHCADLSWNGKTKCK